MRITTKGRYALKAILYLAGREASVPTSIRDISQGLGISPEFLEQLFFKLKKAQLISSVRGPGGGFSLAKAPGEISVKMVFDAVGEGLDITPCTACDTEGPSCETAQDCLTYDVWRAAADQIQNYFTRMNLQLILDGKAREIPQ